MNFILFDGKERQNLLPFTFTRPVAAVRCGILTIAEKWEQALGQKPSYLTESYLQGKYAVQTAVENTLINGSIFPSTDLLQALQQLSVGQGLYKAGLLIAVKVDEQGLKNFVIDQSFTSIEYTKELVKINFPEDLFRMNGLAIKADFEAVTKGRSSQPLSKTNQVLGEHPIFLELGAKVECSILNAQEGPIYIGKDAEIMEGSIIRGPFALCEHGQVKMGAKIYGPTTVGPYSKVGGEVNNSILFGYSNKGHDGFLGNSVIGEWCNLGADTNNSNLKNNYAEVKLWDYTTGRFRKTGMQFCGLMMADHAKCGINTMFNTGTVVGVAANVFGAGFPRNFIPDFSWGGASGFEVYQLPKVYETAALVMERRGLELNETEKSILDSVFELTQTHRNF